MYLKSPVQREYLFWRYPELSLLCLLNLPVERTDPTEQRADAFPSASNEMTIISGVRRKIGIIHWGRKDSWYIIISQLIPLIGKSSI